MSDNSSSEGGSTWMGKFLRIALAAAAVIIIDQFIFDESVIGSFFSRNWNLRGVLVGLLIVAGFIIAIIFIMMRGENHEFIKKLRERFGRMIWGAMKKNAAQLSGIGWPKRETPEGMMPPIIKEELHVFHALSNYMLRLFVFFSKWRQVKDAHSVIHKAYQGLNLLKQEKILINHIQSYRTGGDLLAIDPDGKTRVSGRVEGGGLFGNYESIINAYNDAIDIMDQQLFDMQNGLKDFGPGQAQKLKDVVKKINALSGNLQSYSDELMERLGAYGNNHVIRGWMTLVFDQVNPSGRKWAHYYLFVPKGTELVDKDGNDAGRTTEEMTEVDCYGYVLDDIHELKDQYGSLPGPFKEKNGEPNEDYKVPKRVKNPMAIENHPDPYQVTALIDTEWQGFMQDLRSGQFHPYSKAWEDYEHFIQNRAEFYNEKKIRRAAILPSRKDMSRPAFDREALKNPGQFVYWGRKKYDDSLRGIEEKNPYPTLTNRGMTLYLHEVVEKDIASSHEAHDWLTRFIGDTSEWPDHPRDASKAIELMSGAVKKEK